MKEEITIRKVKHPRYGWRLSYKNGNERKTEYFRRKTGEGGAEERKAQLEQERLDHGSKAEIITDEEREAVMQFRRIQADLPEHAKSHTLSSVVEMFKQQISGTFVSMTFIELTELAYAEIEKVSLSRKNPERHLDSLRHEYDRFNAQWGERDVASITSDEIEQYLDNLQTVCRRKLKRGERFTPSPLSASSKNHYRGTLFQLFKIAAKKNAIASELNPMLKVDKFAKEIKDVKILSTSEAAALLSSVDSEFEAAIAISLFAGLRRSEVLRLEWSDIDLEDGNIHLSASKAKRGAARNIDISNNLKLWLLPHVIKHGLIVPSKKGYVEFSQRKADRDEIKKSGMHFDTALKKAKKKGQVQTWQLSIMRKSYGSYHLRMHNSEDLTKLALGHTNPNTFNTHYKSVKPTKKDAKAYWNITPIETAADDTNITNIKSA